MKPPLFRARRGSAPPRARGHRPVFESLEDRLLLFVLSGYQWADPNVSYSFMPDGTDLVSGQQSQLFANLDARFATTVWQAEFRRALDSWAEVSGLTFHEVSDDGSPQGTSGLAQGDPRFGDIRFAMEDMGSLLGHALYPAGTTASGDVSLGSTWGWNIGNFPDLYSVVLHETGHALGLEHSDVTESVMVPTAGVYTGLYQDDIDGIQAMYGLPPGEPPPPPPPDDPLPADRFEVDDTMASSHDFGTINGLAENGLTVGTSTDMDFYSFVPRKNGKYAVSLTFAQLDGDLDLTIYDAQGNPLAGATSTTDNESLTLSLAGGMRYYVKVNSPTGETNTYDFTIEKLAGGGGGKGGGSGKGGKFSTALVFRGGKWFADTDGRGGGAEQTVTFGIQGDVPVLGDWDGNGTEDLGVFRNGMWYFDLDGQGGNAEKVFAFGLPGDVPVVGDFNGDGITDAGVFRDGVWFFDLDGDGQLAEKAFAFGIAGDVPVTGDFDGDGITDAGVRRGNRWFYDLDGQGGNAEKAISYGLATDSAVVGDWDGDGTDDIGVVRNGKWFLDTDGDGGNAEKVFAFGLESDLAASFSLRGEALHPDEVDEALLGLVEEL